MGRTLLIGCGNQSESFSRCFTEVVWQNSEGLFGDPPAALPFDGEIRICRTALEEWFEKVLATAANGPMLCQIWRTRKDGLQESDVAYAWHHDQALMIEAVGQQLNTKAVERFPNLDYQPPQWRGAERFDQTYAGTPLSLQAECPADFFADELGRLRALLEQPGESWIASL